MRLFEISVAIVAIAASGLFAQELTANAIQNQGTGTDEMTRSNSGEGVADLPYSRGKRFRTLDEYLAHLEGNGAIDLPWWREIRPGVYELVVHMRGARPEIATRAELMRRYGFSR
ncbi:hypothetical protein RCO27_01120 [Sphingosinicella sp. LHD-64]|uniref:hypothetical protein n=1 Tax=Sphingosinicella sp. LHD-64 TaxID=3072139 RepID=UPI00281031F6|nr:hypothetical protein [Sphingosinicella sp. LHD-64]MDQ8754816.1 hypothetical protein [Sphingosinicella sp. LHD-64]